MKNIEINHLSFNEITAYINGLQAFKDFALSQTIIGISKYSYNTLRFTLDNGIILSASDTIVQYCFIDKNTNEETFYRTYQEALSVN